MDQMSIVVFLRVKGISAIDLHAELVHVLGSDAIAYLSVTNL
jgi:hypothetical protein